MIQKAFKENKRFIKSEIFHAGIYDNIRFFFTLYPNGKEMDQINSAWIYLNVLNDENVEIKGELDFEVMSAGQSFKFKGPGNANNCEKLICSFQHTGCNGIQLIPDVLTAKDSFYMLKCSGLFKFMPFKKWYLTKKMINGQNKDFKIFVHEKTIKVHKYVLQNISSIFEVLVQNKELLRIKDFSYDIVKICIDFYYGIEITGILGCEKLISILYFAEKYKMNDLKTKAEYILMTKLSFQNVSQLLNVATECNAKRLKTIAKSKLQMLSFLNGIGTSDSHEIQCNFSKHKGCIKQTKRRAQNSAFHLVFVGILIIFSLAFFL